ncbi:hypothetical protein HMPREF3039_01079 [Akkermansia sp. KLE1798]|nr:hypothetical protein HMPREF3039_01079 [Akkermansia sp. KLE1798]
MDGTHHSRAAIRDIVRLSTFNSPSGSVNRLQSGATDRLSRSERERHPAERKNRPNSLYPQTMARREPYLCVDSPGGYVLNVLHEIPCPLLCRGHGSASVFLCRENHQD